MQSTTKKVLAKLGLWLNQDVKVAQDARKNTDQNSATGQRFSSIGRIPNQEADPCESLHLVTDNLLAHQQKMKAAEGKNYSRELEYLSSGVLYKVGTELLKCKDYDRSLVYFAAILKKDPYSRPAVEKAVEVLMTIGYNNDAKTLCEKYLSRYPADQSMLSHLYDIYKMEK